MKIKLDITVFDFDGKPIKDVDGVTDITIGRACIRAILDGSIDNNTSGEERYSRYKLAQKFESGSEIDLTLDEISKIKNYVGKLYMPLLVGRIYDHFESELQ